MITIIKNSIVIVEKTPKDDTKEPKAKWVLQILFTIILVVICVHNDVNIDKVILCLEKVAEITAKLKQ